MRVIALAVVVLVFVSYGAGTEEAIAAECGTCWAPCYASDPSFVQQDQRILPEALKQLQTNYRSRSKDKRFRLGELLKLALPDGK